MPPYFIRFRSKLFILFLLSTVLEAWFPISYRTIRSSPSNVKMQKNMISTSEWCKKDPFTGWNNQHSQCHPFWHSFVCRNIFSLFYLPLMLGLEQQLCPIVLRTCLKLPFWSKMGTICIKNDLEFNGIYSWIIKCTSK